MSSFVKGADNYSCAVEKEGHGERWVYTQTGLHLKDASNVIVTIVAIVSQL